jgi:cell division protein FtsQ
MTVFSSHPQEFILAMTQSISETQVVSILDRRKQLKSQRRQRFWQATWRTTAILGCAVGLGWTLSNPQWEITRAEHIKILGNQQIATPVLEFLTPLTFPNSLLTVNPHLIRSTLEKHTHLNRVLITRQLFPPQVIIQVQERSPVAIANCRRCVLLVKPAPQMKPILLGPSDRWLLDEKGIAMPAESYPKLAQEGKIPELSAEGYFQDLKPTDLKTADISQSARNARLVTTTPTLQRQWQQIFAIAQKSPVQVKDVIWENQSTLKLKTALGLIHLGTYRPKQFAAQLRALDVMRSLPERIELHRIAYIDLENPDKPVLELKNQPKLNKPSNSS